MLIPAPFDLFPYLLQGVGVTIKLLILSSALAFIMSFLVGYGRLSRYRIISVTATVYLEFFRGTSLLVQLFWAYFVLPFFGISLSAMATGILVIGLNYGAYGSEIVRSSILSIPKAQTEAGISLNMTRFQISYRVILPQAMAIMLPSFGNLVIELLKGTALVSLITLNDLMFQGTILRNTTLRTVEVFSLVLMLYFILAYPIILGVRKLENRLSVWRA